MQLWSVCTVVFRSLVTKIHTCAIDRPIQNIDFELVYCACVEKFVSSNLKTAVPGKYIPEGNETHDLKLIVGASMSEPHTSE